VDEGPVGIGRIFRKRLRLVLGGTLGIVVVGGPPVFHARCAFIGNYKNNPAH